MVQDARQRTKTYLELYLNNGNLTEDTYSGTSGTADSGTTTTTVDTERTEADDYWNGYYIKFGSGANTGFERLVSDFNATTDTITHAAFPNTVAATDTYVLSATSTPATYIVAFGNPDYPILKVFRGSKNVDLVFSIGEPNSTPLLGFDKIAFGYDEEVPVTVYAIDKTGITGTKLKWKAEAELRRILETYPLGSVRSMSKRRDADQIIGDTFIYGTEFLIKYRRDTT